MQRTHVFVGSSLDGFIAGPNDELDWLTSSEGEVPDSFAPFFAQIGAVLMGRRTYDVVSGFTGAWQYGDTPVLVATSRLLTAKQPSVRAVQGAVAALVEQAKQAAGARDVYIDGGRLIRAALDAGLVDEITVTVVPMILGSGIALFAGAARRHPLELISARTIGGAAVELKYRMRR
jgi:dihydrofolate reductase